MKKENKVNLINSHFAIPIFPPTAAIFLFLLLLLLLRFVEGFLFPCPELGLRKGDLYCIVVSIALSKGNAALSYFSSAFVAMQC